MRPGDGIPPLTRHTHMRHQGIPVSRMSLLQFQALLAAAALVVAPASASEELLPHSTSPDGKLALVFTTLPKDSSADPQLYVVQLPSRRRVSGPLVPTGDQIAARTETEAKRNNRNFSTNHLYRLITYEAERILARSEGYIADYEITWSPRATRLTVSGGAHKFSHSVSYRLTKGTFNEVR